MMLLQSPTRLANWTYTGYSLGTTLERGKDRPIGNARTSSQPTRSTLESTLSESAARVALAMAAACVLRSCHSCYRESEPCRHGMKAVSTPSQSPASHCRCLLWVGDKPTSLCSLSRRLSFFLSFFLPPAFVNLGFYLSSGLTTCTQFVFPSLKSQHSSRQPIPP
jgi:hypothetical protein